MSWITELAKVENDTHRATGGVEPLLLKYRAAAGPVIWQDSPLGEFISIVGDEWLSGLTPTQRNTLLTTHVINGSVTLSNAATRSGLAPLLTQAQIDQMTSSFSSRDTLASTLGLSAPTRDILVRALTHSADGYYRDNVRAKKIRRAIAQFNFKSLSLAELETIYTVIGG